MRCNSEQTFILAKQNHLHMKKQHEYLLDLKAEMRIAINRLIGSDLSNEKFKKNSFEQFASAINAKLKPIKTRAIISIGKTISWEVLREIMNYDYKISDPIDVKVRKTLSKICIYLNYVDWADFIKKMNEGISKSSYARDEAIKSRMFEAIRALNTNLSPLVPDEYLRNLEPYCSKDYIEAVRKSLSAKVGIKKQVPKLSIKTITVIKSTPTYARLLIVEERSRREEVKSRSSFIVLNAGRKEAIECVYTLLFLDGSWKIYSRYYLTYKPFVGLDFYRELGYVVSKRKL